MDVKGLLLLVYGANRFTLEINLLFMNTSILEQLYRQGIIDEELLTKIKAAEENKPVAINYELKTLMYAGILLLTTGLGIIVYKNLDSIGHLAIVLFIAIATLGCFSFCIKKSGGFTTKKVAASNLLTDYTLLLGCLLLLIFIAYIQYEYNAFGNRWGMATFIPMIVLFIAAYYFDHLGVLSLAIVNLAAWAGITITPLRLLQENDFSNSRLIFTGFAIGGLLMLLAFLSVKRDIKSHFYFTYKNFGTHFLFIAAIAALIHFDKSYLLWIIPLIAIAYLQFRAAVKERSFYFLVITALYFYAGISYIFIHVLFQNDFSEGALYIALFYFIFSAFALIFFLIRYNKLLKTL